MQQAQIQQEQTIQEQSMQEQSMQEKAMQDQARQTQIRQQTMMPATQFERFASLHAGRQPLILPNAWDAASAALLQLAGVKAMATSSAAMAWSLGYRDGGALPPGTLLNAVAAMMRVSSLPLSVDIEAGYSDNPAEVVTLVEGLVALGVVGINLEDGDQAPELMEAKIVAIRASASCRALFINARTDVFLRELATGESAIVKESVREMVKEEAAIAMTLARLRRYQAAGADGGFIPGVSSVAVAKRLAEGINMPLNLMLPADSTEIPALFNAGIGRFSYGPAGFLTAYSAFLQASQEFMVLGEEQTRVRTLDYATVDGLFA